MRIIPGLQQFGMSLDNLLGGTPEQVINIALLICAGVIVWGIFKWPSWSKAILLAYVILP